MYQGTFLWSKFMLFGERMNGRNANETSFAFKNYNSKHQNGTLALDIKNILENSQKHIFLWTAVHKYFSKK